ncbi:MAG TPA: hypothetical protein VHE37_09015 [Nevskiaceae bacterium]|nr:hypothetical protein [Nevskiaceae bacterium]
MSEQKYTYVGKGKLAIGPYDDSGPKLHVGNCSKLELSVEQAESSVEDFTSAGGGEYDSIERITGVGASFTLYDLSPLNLARDLRGQTSEYTATPVVNEQHKAWKNGVVDLNKVPDPDEDLVVTPHGSTGAFVEGTDYERTLSGIKILEDGDIEDEDQLDIDYTPLPSTIIEALTQAGKKYKLLFEGLNEANSGKPVIVRGHCVNLAPLASLPLIGTDFASYDVAGKLLKDLAITGTGLSQYFTVHQAK